MGYVRLSLLLAALVLAVLTPATADAASPLLERVKNNPTAAARLCAQFRQFNAQGLSATSPTAIASVAREQNLSPIDAEVLATYVIGMYCPEVR